MGKYMLAGADVHEASVLVKWAVDRQAPQKRSFSMCSEGRSKMIGVLKQQAKEAGAEEIVLVYEACCFGFGLYDQLTEAGIRCHVLAPTKIARCPKHRRSKTDEKDAERLLEVVRGHCLAGNELPAVWVPDHETRQDRMVVRRRLQVGEKLSGVKAQVQMLLKGAGLRRPPGVGKGWTRAYREWLDGLCNARGSLQYGQALAMESMLRELDWLEGELAVQDQNVETLSQGERYAQPVEELRKLKGVGVLTAMVFLTEMGDLSRFSNRRKVGAYLGLVPSSQETGEDCDRKGHITRQGSWRVRKVLCQAAWSRLRSDALTQAVYRRLAARNPKKKKIALVAMMRRLAVRMWHVGRAAQQRAHCFPESECVGVT